MFRPIPLLFFLALAASAHSLTLAAAAHSVHALQISTARITGVVIDATTGEPIPGVRVMLAPAPLDELQSEEPFVPPRVEPAETNADGVFVMTGVAHGPWHILVEKTGFYLVDWNVLAPIIDVAEDTIDLPDIRLDRGGAITGRIFDEHGNPLRNLMVSARQRMPREYGTSSFGLILSPARTNELGEFTLERLPPGEYYVVARSMTSYSSSPGRTTFVDTHYPGVRDEADATPVSVTRDGTAWAVDFQMLAEALYEVAGMVVDTSRRPVPGALVRLILDGGTVTSHWGTSLSDGRFRFVNVAPGNYWIQATVPGVAQFGTMVPAYPQYAAPGISSPMPEIVVQDADVMDLQVEALNR
jgi:hypothetical protein